MMNFYTFSTYVSLVETGAGLLLLIGCAIGAQLYNYKVNRHNTVHVKFHTLLILLYNPFCKIWPLTFVVVEGFLNVRWTVYIKFWMIWNS